MDTLAERLKYRRAQLRLSQSAVAKAVAKKRGRAFSQQAYGALESGTAQSSAEIAATAEVLQVALEWLRDGKGDPPTGHHIPPVSAVDGDIGRTSADAILEIDVRAGAGGGCVPVESYVTDGDGNAYAAEGVRDEWRLPATIMRELLHAAPQHIRAFEVIGDSMVSPDSRQFSLYPGDRVFVDTRDTRAHPEGVFVLWDGFGVVVKRLQLVRGADPARVKIISANPQYEAYEATVEEIRIIGRYAGRFTTF